MRATRAHWPTGDFRNPSGWMVSSARPRSSEMCPCPPSNGGEWSPGSTARLRVTDSCGSHSSRVSTVARSHLGLLLTS